jgi:hypothetical protein
VTVQSYEKNLPCLQQAGCRQGRETMNRTNFTGRFGVISVKSAICEEKTIIPVDGDIDDINVIFGLY